MTKIKKDTIETGAFYRHFDVRGDSINEDARTVELSFSSELPYERYFGMEVLGHDAGEVDMSRMDGGAALLVDHDWTDVVGVVEAATISESRGKALVRFGKGQRASEVWQDVQDGIRRHISVGYFVNEMRQEAAAKEGEVDTFRVVDWTPFEVSVVAVPADPSVGFGRNEVAHKIATRVAYIETPKPVMAEEKTMSQDKKLETQTQPKLEVKTVDVRKQELDRITNIEALGAQHSQTDMAREAIASGKSLDTFRAQLLDTVAKPVVSQKSADVGMDTKDIEQFSFARAINALANPHDRSAQEAAGFEYECSRAACDVAGVESRGLRVPNDVLKRDLAAASSPLVDTQALGFVDVLRNSSLAMQRGTTLAGLNGNVKIPRKTAGATAYWVAEAGAITESTPTLGQIDLAPKTVGAYTDVSRRLTLQSSLDVEAMIREDLARALAVEIDAVAINGGGTNQPTGILQTTGIGAVVGGTNGAAIDWADMVNLEREVSVDNALLGDLAYMTNAKVVGALKQTLRATSVGGYCIEDGQSNGYDVLMSNNAPSNLDKGSSVGVCSAIVFGNWRDLILGFWGGLDLTVDPYSESTKGTIRVVALQDMDIAVRHAASFAAMQDALTA
jgi:HK97 family phage major capsid protein